MNPRRPLPTRQFTLDIRVYVTHNKNVLRAPFEFVCRKEGRLMRCVVPRHEGLDISSVFSGITLLPVSHVLLCPNDSVTEDHQSFRETG